MRDEQREAIDTLKEITENDLLNYWEGTERPYNAIQIVLSLIKEQQEEIEKLKNKEVLIKRYFKKCDLIKQKDKQIDLMAEEIIMTKPANCTRTNEFNTEKVYMSKEEIKQYFADLVEKEN